MAEVGALLGAGRLVTLTGPGGVGKTRLALAVAGLAAGAHPDGVCLVELAGASGETATVAGIVAAELDVRDDTATGSRPGVRPAALPHRLADALRGRRLLLVLDNCEHVVEPVAELVDLLLRAAPGLRVLATSQESLAIPGRPCTRCHRSRSRCPDRTRRGPPPYSCSWPAPRPPRPGSCSTRTVRPRWRRSAGGWTGCRWRWSSPPPGCARWACAAWPTGWTTASTC
ncbi:AAA family ATPase [Nonomuraea rubra]|uniref:AAA family ATPase n=1 Tax=Nonomuraea rubra TaxID=46180 RepID=UPI0036150B0F